ncbi:hypothetical protein SAMN05660657_05688 [Geodermatophilus amargosae]|uniref:Uncharacterized protein n=1 Tax=Geodermatophilus amargosae TaxID=1296565 RepID=A0A1I7DEP8_9ACTN|nr:hypothetical protein [Geodermatophilus amargosae]SFU10128.1 hypothetical protein SAMN05660657_05688 [Geodermatophilus amargosae]
MPQDISFSYRLPLTYVRVTGTRTETTDGLTGQTTVECRSTVTTETGADLLTRCPVSISPEALARQKTTWNLLEDKRLAGADVTSTVEPLAAWKASLSAGMAVLSAGLPLVVGLSLGPPGWIALAGAAGAATLGAGLGSRRYLVSVSGEEGLEVGGDVQPPEPPADVGLAQWNVDSRYGEEKPREAQILAGYRAALADASAAHATAVRAIIADSEGSDSFYWEQRLKSLELVLQSASVGAMQAEAAYTAWKASKLQTVVTDCDERLRIDVLPDRAQLQEWAADTAGGTAAWMKLAAELRIGVSVELEHILGDNQKLHLQEFQPFATADVVHFRQPRPANLEIWRLTPEGATAYSLKRVEVRRLLVAFPGNEETMLVHGGRGASSAVQYAFAASGGLTNIVTDQTDPALQRAHDILDLIPALKNAAEAGSSIRTALSPPSLVDRAAEAKAAQELGLLTGPEDPLKELKDKVAEQELRARLRLAEQMATATSPPVFVTVRGPASE